VDGSIGNHSENLSFLSVAFIEILGTGVRLRKVKGEIQGNILIENDVKPRQITTQKGMTIATFLVLLLWSTTLYADRILVIGDSWAEPVGNQLQVILTENGHTDVIVQATPIVYSARGLSSPEEIDRIAGWLNAWPDTSIVHLSIGGNDWGNNWTPDMAGTQEEADLFAAVVNDVETIVDYTLSIRPDVQIVWPSYDFGRPSDGATPTENNTAEIQMAELAAQLAMTKPGLNFVDIVGTLQVKFGFNGVQYTEFDPPYVIPPGDPSLPDPTLPSPYTAFNNPGAPLHPNQMGYKALAQADYELFYRPLLNGQNFHVNAGHSGAWFNPETSGQGQLIDVVPESQFMFLAWFTFTAAASNNPDQQHWYTAQGNYSNNSAELILHETLGGQFDAPREVSTNPIGTVTVNFSDCEQGQMVYNIDTDGREGTIPMQRVIPGSGNVCEQQIDQGVVTTEAVDINAGIDGSWVNEETLGQGFLIDAHPNPDGGNFIFVAWFTYGDDTASGQRWLTAQGDFEGATAEIDIHETTGGRFDDPLFPNTAKVGTMTIDFTDCSNAQLSYLLTDDDLANDMAIIRLIPGGQALCEELAGAD
jgi:hypothetical protein